eukprot:2819663-Pyramimonas_sp.AAC.2
MDTGCTDRAAVSISLVVHVRKNWPLLLLPLPRPRAGVGLEVSRESERIGVSATRLGEASEVHRPR